jgi:alkylation response protein AidB-like acyl-CoA dehydrogenase
MNDDSQIREMRTMMRTFLREEVSARHTLQRLETYPVLDDKTWRLMVEQLGLSSLIVPESLGGQGFGFDMMGLVLEEMGREVCPGPFFATSLLATRCLLMCENEEVSHLLLERIAAGEATATVAFFEPGSRWSTEPSTTAKPMDTGWQLSGSKDLVIDGATADIVLVSARIDADTTGVFVVDSSHIIRTPISVLDLTRPLARIDLDSVPAQLLSWDARKVLDNLLAGALAGLACEQAGGLAACLDLVVEHTSNRVQFGRQLATFQAVRHRCADMFVLAETSSAAAQAAVTSVMNDDEAAFNSRLAAAWCSDSYLAASAQAIQLLGGIGFTWEHPAHLYFKRAKSSQVLFGTPSQHRVSIASDLLAVVEPSGARS